MAVVGGTAVTTLVASAATASADTITKSRSDPFIFETSSGDSVTCTISNSHAYDPENGGASMTTHTFGSAAECDDGTVTVSATYKDRSGSTTLGPTGSGRQITSVSFTGPRSDFRTFHRAYYPACNCFSPSYELHSK